MGSEMCIRDSRDALTGGLEEFWVGLLDASFCLRLLHDGATGRSINDEWL